MKAGRRLLASVLGPLPSPSDEVALSESDLEQTLTTDGVVARPGKGLFRQAHLHPTVLASVGTGGFVGTLARDGVTSVWTNRTDAFPGAIFLINCSGALLIGIAMTLIMSRSNPSRLARPALCVGLLGGWTTMSTLAVDSDHLFGAAAVATACANLFLSVAAGLTACAVGIAIVRRLRPRDDLDIAGVPGASPSQPRATP